MTSTYRTELNGIRAVSIIAVFIYHLNPQFLAGGYLGVDVFITLSGFLIIGQISTQLEKKQFYLLTFWHKRIKRLLPALCFMIIALALATPFIFPYPDSQQIPPHSFAALFSLENIHLWINSSNYWSSSNENNPLLHTWSLSLEEQFYLCLPILLIVTTRLKKAWLNTVLVSLFVISLALSVVHTPINQSTSFYLLPFRMWEFLLGYAALLLCRHLPISHKKLTEIICTLSFATLISCFIYLKQSPSFPSFFPLIPCGATALLIYSSSGSSITKKILSLPVLSHIGKLSYSIYLWHWPIIVASRYLSTDPSYLVIILVTLLCSTISYYCIEKPLRYGGPKASKIVYALPVVALGLSVTLPSYSPPQKESTFQTVNALEYAKDFDATSSLKTSKAGLTFNPSPDPIHIAIFGSSHARVYTPQLLNYSQEHNYQFTSLATAGHSITTNPLQNEKQLKESKLINEARIQWLAKNQTNLLIVTDIWTSLSRHPQFERELKGLLSNLQKHTDLILVVGQPPLIELPSQYRGALNKYLTALNRSNAAIELKNSSSVETSNLTVKMICEQQDLANVHFVSLESLLLHDNQTVRFLINDKRSYSDYHHLSEVGAHFIFIHALRERLNEKLDHHSTKGKHGLSDSIKDK